MSNALIECIREMEMEEYLEANKYTSKETIQLRTLEKILPILDITQSNLKKLTSDISYIPYIHPQVSTFLSENIPPEYKAFDPEERHLVRKIYSADRHDERDVKAFCDLMDRKVLDSNLRHFLNVAFAIDGYGGTTLSMFIYNLRFGLSYNPDANDEPREIVRVIAKHVLAVRHLHLVYGPVKVETINEAVRNALNVVESTNPHLKNMTKSYVGSVKELLDPIKAFIAAEHEEMVEKEILDLKK